MLPGSSQCKSCGLFFLPEEVPDRFNQQQRWCVRCVLVNHSIERDGFVPPACYGVAYNGSAPACVRVCKIAAACLIQFVDSRSVDWSLSLERRGVRYSKGHIPLAYHAARILKAAGRPMHLFDLCPIISKLNKGRLKSGPEKADWHPKLRAALVKCSDIVALGSDFFVWVGCWSPEMGGNVGHHGIYDETRRLMPVSEIISKIVTEKSDT